MLRYLLLLALFAYIRADDEVDLECCSVEDRKEISAVWGRMWAAKFIGRRVLIAQAVFEEWVPPGLIDDCDI